jgi:hypothetical protein
MSSLEALVEAEAADVGVGPDALHARGFANFGDFCGCSGGHNICVFVGFCVLEKLKS